MTNAREIFASNGPIAASLTRYEKRISQVQMAQAIEDVLQNNGVLLAEAGTGTGKTIAYLAPILLSGRKTIISTGTRNLQEQIFFKDLTFLISALGVHRTTAYLKGQNNYLCMTRLRQFLSSPRCLSYSSAEVARLVRFSQTSDTGDRMEIDGMSDDDPIWLEVCSTRDTRIGVNCPFYEECFVTKARKAAMLADITIVNHHLYFADLSTRQRGGSILPSHEVVVFDEAHLIEDIATEFFGIKVSTSRIERVIEDCLRAVVSAAFAEDPYEESRRRGATTVHSATALLFDALRGESGRFHLEPADLTASVIQSWHRLDATIESFEMTLRVHEGVDPGVDHATSRIQGLRADLAEIIEGREKGMVYWVETRPKSVSLGASPIDISKQFREGVLFSRDVVALVSATLSTGGNFEFFKSRLGIDFEIAEMSLPTPFNYAVQAGLYIPRHLPAPKSPHFKEQAVLEIRRLIALSRGGALVLCTSISAMNWYYKELLSSTEGPLLVQGETPKSTLIEQFLRDPASTLVATTSFWQGVDIPGDHLRMVIIDKLPFAPPTDPVTAARIAKINESEKDAFKSYQVPQAALLLKQGFGRLIRTAWDHGMVAILDTRLHTMGYGKIFLASLPGCPRFSDFESAAAWWEESRKSIHHPHHHRPVHSPTDTA